MQYFAENFANLRFLLKVDDDTFVRLAPLVEALQAVILESPFEDTLPLYWGYFDGRAPVQKKGKWKESTWVLRTTPFPTPLGSPVK